MARSGPGYSTTKPSIEVIPMQLLMDSTLVLGAIQYSLAYMLVGGGLFGAIAIYIGAKMLGK
jgi:hypothetical protein